MTEKSSTTAILERVLQTIGGLALTACFILWNDASKTIQTQDVRLKAVETKTDEQSKEIDRRFNEIDRRFNEIKTSLDKLDKAGEKILDKLSGLKP